jgi:hypothetical protein|tara:strand:- start:109 stop:426 length:318 start_codon:yes stop_codon:yes gene_type:complete
VTIDNITPQEWDQAIDKLATNNQVGGTHYNHLKIQPIDYIYANKLSYNLGSCLKYITRNKGDREDRIKDLLKAKHFIDLELEMVYGIDADGNDIGKYSVEVLINE